MQIEKHLHELLYTADCVIVPGLGGFVANTRPTFMNPAQHTFSPPFKRFAFNASLNINDGLLANAISTNEGISYAEALAAIQEFVDEAFVRFNSGSSVHLENIGSLSFDLEQHLQFEPDMNANYLLSSFGLNTIHSPAIRRDEQQPKMRTVRNTDVTKSNGRRSAWRLLELVPIAAILTLLMINPRVIENLNTGLASLNPFHATVEAPEVPVTINHPITTASVPVAEVATPTVTDSSAAQTSAPTPDAGFESAVSAQPSSTPITSSSEKEKVATAEPVHTHVEVSEPTAASSDLAGQKGTYYIIGGCFSILSNAENFKASAVAQGYKAEIIGLNEKGMHMVSIASGNDQALLRTQLSDIKQKVEKGAWVYSRK